VQFAITRVAVPRRAKGPDPELPSVTTSTNLAATGANIRPGASPVVPPHVAVWRSVRACGDIKTRESRRTLAMPKRCVDALREPRDRQYAERAAAGALRRPT
jgi:hypothetical protein